MRDWITNDFWWKLFSVFLAVAVWLTVHKVREEPAVSSVESGNTLSIGSVPVMVISAGSDVRDFHTLPGTVTVQVNGSRAALAAVLQAKQIHAYVNLTDIANNTSNLKGRVEIAMPPGVTLINVDPPEVGILLPPRPEKLP
jgi:YbbR domain-containing protein